MTTTSLEPQVLPLPFEFTVHNRKVESDGLFPSSPYKVRAWSSAICGRMRDTAARLEKTVIVEDRCATR
jgi:hypothetical protein